MAPTRAEESHHAVAPPGWSRAAFTVLRAGRIATAPAHRIERPSHPGQDVILCLGGAGWVETLGRVHRVERGQLAWIANEAPHAHRPDEERPWRVAWCRIDGPDMPALRASVLSGGGPVVRIADPGPLLAWFERVYESMRRGGPRVELALNALVGELLVIVAEAGPRGRADGVPRVLRELLDAMRARPEGAWGTAEIEAVTGLSPSQTRRLFHRHLGASPRGWLARERLALAQRLLLETEAPLAAIAHRCGYCDVHHFSRRFAEGVGLPPATWRAREAGFQRGTELGRR